MKEDEVKALLVGESPRSFAHIVKRLETAGYRCQFAVSHEEAAKLSETEAFALVLSVSKPQDGAIALLVERLAGTEATFFWAHPVEDGCWWLPALRHGERCFGRPALRPSEFAGELDRIIAEQGVRKEAEIAPVVSVVVLQDTPQRRAVEPVLRATSRAAK